MALDVRQAVSFADVFVVATGRSDRQVRAIADGIAEALAKPGEKPLGIEGYDEGRWVLIDFGDVIVHVFQPDVRAALRPRAAVERSAPCSTSRRRARAQEGVMTRPVMLVVLDGFGIGDGGPADATAQAHTPFLDHARRHHPCARIETSGEAVGLPPGQMGNSEVGHMTMGAGRIIEMDMTRIGKALRGDELERNPALGQAFAAAAQPGVTLHLLGLVSDGGVHSHQEHLEALLAHCGAAACGPPCTSSSTAATRRRARASLSCARCCRTSRPAADAWRP